MVPFRPIKNIPCKQDPSSRCRYRAVLIQGDRMAFLKENHSSHSVRVHLMLSDASVFGVAKVFYNIENFTISEYAYSQLGAEPQLDVSEFLQLLLLLSQLEMCGVRHGSFDAHHLWWADTRDEITALHWQGWRVPIRPFRRLILMDFHESALYSQATCQDVKMLVEEINRGIIHLPHGVVLPSSAPTLDELLAMPCFCQFYHDNAGVGAV